MNTNIPTPIRQMQQSRGIQISKRSKSKIVDPLYGEAVFAAVLANPICHPVTSCTIYFPLINESPKRAAVSEVDPI
jgi:hypothetical protein